ncbi:recombination-associated protein RdgC [Raoultella ornithinolytica]|uniref:recombination-associated protein RdgC n=1 Tax=Raoultella ornithinolytica TaxID=54291 RepID=UPI002A5A42C3|nr:recombination-associated protein RdgC [Raoultella ornithinolytica]WPO25479.1 recombination-associated protein RdgC [Raoultella ornithinolytica]
MNFFKNALIYRLSRDITIVEEHTIADLAEKLEPFRFSPCGSQDMSKSGWVSPLGQYSDQLFHFVSGQLLLVMRREEKIIPRPTITDELNKKISKLESEQARRLKKTEKDSLRDEVLHSLLPRAFSRNTIIRIWVNTTDNLVIVDASSARRAEDTPADRRRDGSEYQGAGCTGADHRLERL